MARRTTGKSKPVKKTEQKTAGRPIWTGSIDFGLVTIAVKLYPGQTSSGLDFDLLDKRDFNRVRYRRVNEKTGEEVKWDQIVKGYQYEKGEYVALSDKDFEQANAEATHSIEIMDFVDASEISPVYFETPYYVVPQKNSRRAYALLRDVMKKTGKVAIAKIVLRTRQHLAALLPLGSLLVLMTLRYAHELRDPSRLDLPEEAKAKDSAVSGQELKMAEQLITAMAGEWDPTKYTDEYHEDLLKLIDQKIKAGKTKVVASGAPAARAKAPGKVIDIMHLLRESVKEAQAKEARPRQRKAS
jgi:DNA end-binding protein Ku